MPVVPIWVFPQSGHREHSRNAIPLDASLASLARDFARTNPGDHAQLHFSETRFLCPIAAAWLKAHVVRARLKDVRVDVAPGDHVFSTASYFSREIDRSGEQTYGHTLELRHFAERDLRGFIQYAGEEWFRLLPRLSSEDRSYLAETVAELYENVFLHAHSDVGAVVGGQHYSRPYSPEAPELHLAVVDLGDTIPTRIAERAGIRPEEINPAKALEFAFRPRTSSAGSRRGTGLASFRQFIENNDAEVECYSGAGLARLSRESVFERLAARIPGTAYDIILRGVSWIPRGEGENEHD